MEKLHQELWIVTAANQLFGPAVKALLDPLGFHIDPAHAIPDYLVMCVIIVFLLTGLSLLVRSQLTVEKPGTLQILLEDVVLFLNGLLTE